MNADMPGLERAVARRRADREFMARLGAALARESDILERLDDHSHVTCPACAGEGEDALRQECAACGGRGLVEVQS